MGISYTLLLTLFLALALAIVNWSAADLEVQGDSKTGKNVEISNKKDSGNDKVVIPGKKGKDQVDSGSKDGAKNKINSDSDSKQELTKGAGSEQKKKDDTDSEQKKKEDKGPEKEGNNKEKAKGDPDLESKDGTMTQVRKEGGEACDSSSNSCTIKEKSVVACLRVPGNESPDLSLLIQNKGKGPVSVTISAPDFVELEKKQVQVEESKNEKVKVSIGNGEAKSSIILKAGNGNCTLDFKEMIAQSSRKDTGSSQLAYINLLKSTSSVWFVFLGVVLVVALVLIGMRVRRKHFARNSPSYEKLEMELPVSGGNKAVPDSNDGWDEGWDDSWDDEEAPKTPSMLVTPSLSSNGISSRRINKDAWKD